MKQLVWHLNGSVTNFRVSGPDLILGGGGINNSKFYVEWRCKKLYIAQE